MIAAIYIDTRRGPYVAIPSRRLLDPSRLDSGRPRGARGIVECLSKNQRHLTPPAFAQWLVSAARSAR
jgi:hypothetical protein